MCNGLTLYLYSKMLFCALMFKMFSAIEKHLERKHPVEAAVNQNVSFWDNKDSVLAVSQLQSLDSLRILAMAGRVNRTEAKT